jgi:hypothetical protein
LKKIRDSKKGSKAQADSLKDVDLADERSIAQKMVGEMLETYQQKIGLPKVISRKRWFQNMHISRLIVTFHLPRVDLKRRNWNAEHLA